MVSKLNRLCSCGKTKAVLDSVMKKYLFKIKWSNYFAFGQAKTQLGSVKK